MGIPTTLPPFDCSADYDKWFVAWTIAKAEWCCKHEGKGCAEPMTTTILEPFDCGAGGSAQVHEWPARQRDWCCQHRGIACSSTTTRGRGMAYNCRAEPTTAWTSEKR